MANKVRLTICGSSYVISTNESEDYMQNLAERLNLDMNELMSSSNSVSITTAAIMTALNYRDELEKASGSADNMRRQIKDYLEDAASAKMAAEEARRENASLKRRVDELERRLRAARMAGLHEVPCIIMELDLEEASFIALVENLQRNDLDFLEEARGIAQLIRLFGLSQEECARRLGKSQSAVANKLRLLRLPEDVLNAMRNAGLTERHGRALLRLETPAEQRAALAYILSRDLNVAATDAYIERLLEAKTAPESEQQKTFILKDVRVFLNTISHSLDLMKQGGIDAGMHRQETDEALILTINIPKARRREPAPKQGEPVPVG